MEPNAATSRAVLMMLAGPAGSGKSTLCDRIVKELPGFTRVVTATTRPPRPGEVQDVHYHFLTPAEFDARLAAGDFLEWAWVHGKHRYGTLASAVLGPLQAGHSLAINIDVQGVESIRRVAEKNPVLHGHLVTVFIDVPEEVLRVRLATRGTDGPEEVERRMVTAREEMRAKSKFEHVIVSSTREADFAALMEIWRRVAFGQALKAR
jgi:guanylate kinase